MLKRILFFTIICMVSSQSASFKNSLIEEYLHKAHKVMGDVKFKEESKSLYMDENYKKANRAEREIFNRGANKPDLNLYENVVPYLFQASATSGSILPAYLAIEIGQHVWLMKNGSLNEKYLKKLAEELYKKRYCNGYLYSSAFNWEANEQEKAITILKEGVVNCKDTYLLLEIRKKFALYKYKNEKMKTTKGVKND